MKGKLGGKILKQFVRLRAKTYSYLINYGSKMKKQEVQKMQQKIFLMKRKVKFEFYKTCLEATHLENKINHLEKNETDADTFKKDHKQLINKIN